MSGHSKWSKVKHQKAGTDAVKSSAFTKASRNITMAVKQGGGVTDPGGNFRLRLAIENAKSVNMPKDTIERAIERGESSTQNLEAVVYEGYGPGGVAIIVEGVTDNKQRTAALVKHLFDRHGGALAAPGAVSYLFSRVGAIETKPTSQSDDILAIALAAGALDIEEGEESTLIYSSDTALHIVADKINQHGLTIASQKIVYRPTTRLEVTSDVANLASHLLNELEALDDVIDVYPNI